MSEFERIVAEAVAVEPERRVLRVAAYAGGRWLVQLGDRQGGRDFDLALGFVEAGLQLQPTERLVPCSECNTRGRTDDGPCRVCERRGWCREQGGKSLAVGEVLGEVVAIWRQVEPEDPDHRTSWLRGP